ncbi:hypothetical protein B0H14DRAFT_3435749 [Mycena olivaceomarginata]|nr:hypothetical protein B0H14DRAFT_3435749 [Mycena olivaceomarginata]
MVEMLSVPSVDGVASCTIELDALTMAARPIEETLVRTMCEIRDARDVHLGIILLLNVWSGKRTGLLLDSSREIANVHKCMEVVRLCEHRWQLADLFWDILWELASVGQLPLVNPTSNPMPPRSQNHPSADKFDRPIHGAQFRVPYTPAPQASVAGGVGEGRGSFGPSPMAPSTFAPAPPPDAWFPPEDTFPGTQRNGEAMDDMVRLIDSDTIAMWTNAPTGFQVDD